jgi:phage head maturation protease
VTDGRISLLLGSQTPLPDVLFEVSSLYLQLTVNDEPLPRMQVASTVYALRAGLAEAVGPGGVSAPALADGAVEAPALAAGAVTEEALAEGSVTTPVLADAAVTATKLAPGAVTTNALVDGVVTSAKLGSSAVVGSVLADGSVTSSKLANGAVTSSKIATGALVSSLNNLTDAVRLVAGEDVTITPDPDAGTITVSVDDNGFPSSRRWKTNVRPLNGLSLVEQLRGVRYEWIEDGTSDVGVIAEEVGAVVPEVVTYAPNGVDAESVHYAKLVALLIEAVNEQQAQIEADRALLQELHSRLDALEQGRSTPEPH